MHSSFMHTCWHLEIWVKLCSQPTHMDHCSSQHCSHEKLFIRALCNGIIIHTNTIHWQCRHYSYCSYQHQFLPMKIKQWRPIQPCLFIKTHLGNEKMCCNQGVTHSVIWQIESHVIITTNFMKHTLDMLPRIQNKYSFKCRHKYAYLSHEIQN